MSLTDIYSPKQLEVLKTTRKNDWFMLINSGAKRSGKTVINNDLFLIELKRVKKIADKQGISEPMYILAGVSSGTIQKNILQELYNKYGLEMKFDKFNNFKLFGVKVVQARTGNISGVGAIRGMTSFGAYINEASLANKQVFAEIISRCSGEGARIICDTNPDNPEHWLKKEYIDKANKNDNILSFHFELDDNTFLNRRYRENIKNTTPSGMFYDRDIKGLWVSGDGVVYPDFDKRKHYISADDVPFDKIETYYCGVDWGYEHWGSIAVMGETHEGIVYLLEEHSAQHEEIDYWVNIAKDIQKRYGKDIRFYADSARPEHVVRFNREKIKTYNANKFIISGIEQVAKLIKANRFFVVHERVNKFKDEIYQYVWNEKTGEPMKENDDVMDSIRYAIYSRYIVKSRSNKKPLNKRISSAKQIFG